MTASAGVRWGHPDRWSALGTYVDLRVADAATAPAAGALARRVLGEVDATCSRFRHDSDLVRANRLAGQWVGVSAVLVGAARVALEAAEQTDGLVDPCLGELVLRAGYDRTFALLRSSPSPVHLPTPQADRWRELDVRDDAVRVPRGAALDLGATGKAYAADLVAHTIVQALDVATVVSVGGDVRAGAPPAGAVGWPVRIAHRLADLADAADLDGCDLAERLADARVGADPADLADPADPAGARRSCGSDVVLTEGGLATSSVTTRRWLRAGREWHHLFDPRTARPAQGPWLTVTALGHSAVAANAASTCAIVLGADAPTWLARRAVAARLVDQAGRAHHTPGWAPTRTDAA